MSELSPLGCVMPGNLGTVSVGQSGLELAAAFIRTKNGGRDATIVAWSQQ